MKSENKTHSTELGWQNTFHAFQIRPYRLLWTGNFLAYTSRWMQMTMLGWMVLELTDSPWLVALTGFFASAPLIILGLIGGMLADKLDRAKLLVSTQTITLVATLTMVFLLVFEKQQFWHAYIISAVIGAGWAIDNPARRSLILDLVGRRWVTNGVALDSVGMQMSRMAGPAIAGGLIALVSLTGGYIFASIAQLTAVVVLVILNMNTDPSILKHKKTISDTTDTGILGELAKTFRYAQRNTVILAVILITIIMNFLLFPYGQMIPVIARDELGVGPGLMGLLMSAEGLGALSGGILVASFHRLQYHGRIFVGGSALALFALFWFSLSPWYITSLPILIILGIGIGGFSTMQSTIIMLVSTEEMRGKTLGVITLAIGSGPLGSLMIGAIATSTDSLFAIRFNSILGLTTMLIVVLLLPAIHKKITRTA
tara:strand:+ start:3715 stop:4998 length:1284 start_codon:yes stop_codon:yes gene_type:complete